MLSVARVTVADGRVEEYIRTVHHLARLGTARGRHLWLFRSPANGHVFLEFSESQTGLNHRSRASRTDLESKLEQRLRAIAHYAPDAGDLWEEVSASQPEESPDVP